MLIDLFLIVEAIWKQKTCRWALKCIVLYIRAISAGQFLGKIVSTTKPLWIIAHEGGDCLPHSEVLYHKFSIAVCLWGLLLPGGDMNIVGRKVVEHNTLGAEPPPAFTRARNKYVDGNAALIL